MEMSDPPPVYISEFEIHYHSGRELFISRPLDNEFDPINYLFYLDYVLSALPTDLAEDVLTHLRRASCIAYDGFLRNGIIPRMLPVRSQRLNRNTSSEAEDDYFISAVCRVCDDGRGNCHFSVSVSPEEINSHPSMFASGMAPLFFEMLEQGSSEMQHLLIVITLLACGWYSDNGVPHAKDSGEGPGHVLDCLDDLTGPAEPLPPHIH